MKWGNNIKRNIRRNKTGGCGRDSSGSRCEPVSRTYEYGTELQNFIQDREFLD
jgi:hypothetical protein